MTSLTYEVCDAELNAVGEVTFDAGSPCIIGGDAYDNGLFLFRNILIWNGRTARYSKEYGVFIVANEATI